MEKIYLASVTSVLILYLSGAYSVAAEDRTILLGSWSGKATGPDGGLPTGEIALTFTEGDDGGVAGKILVKTEGDVQYSGEISKIKLEDKVFSALVSFQLTPEFVLNAEVKGPLKGKSVAGTFVVISKEDSPVGEGTFSVTKDAPNNE